MHGWQNDNRIGVIVIDDLALQYPDEIIQLGNIIERYGNLQENDIVQANFLTRDSLQVYNRFSEIKYQVKKGSTRGQEAALKNRLEEICEYLLKVHTHARMTWDKAWKDKNNKEEF
jgi:hypothetical protein